MVQRPDWSKLYYSLVTKSGLSSHKLGLVTLGSLRCAARILRHYNEKSPKYNSDNVAALEEISQVIAELGTDTR
jgi:hypothetical protein